MMVAWHEVPGNGVPKRIRPVVNGMIKVVALETCLCSRSCRFARCLRDSVIQPVASKPESYRLYETGSLYAVNPGISCQATFILSLRDKKPGLIYIR
jgi:hypothetical protein